MRVHIEHCTDGYVRELIIIPNMNQRSLGLNTTILTSEYNAGNGYSTTKKKANSFIQMFAMISLCRVIDP